MGDQTIQPADGAGTSPDDELPGDWRAASFCCAETEAVLNNILKFLGEVDNPVPRNGDITIEAL